MLFCKPYRSKKLEVPSHVKDFIQKNPFTIGRPVINSGKVFYPVEEIFIGEYGIERIIVDYYEKKSDAMLEVDRLNSFNPPNHQTPS